MDFFNYLVVQTFVHEMRDIEVQQALILGYALKLDQALEFEAGKQALIND